MGRLFAALSLLAVGPNGCSTLFMWSMCCTANEPFALLCLLFCSCCQLPLALLCNADYSLMQGLQSAVCTLQPTWGWQLQSSCHWKPRQAGCCKVTHLYAHRLQVHSYISAAYSDATHGAFAAQHAVFTQSLREPSVAVWCCLLAFTGRCEQWELHRWDNWLLWIHLHPVVGVKSLISVFMNTAHVRAR